MPIKAPVRIAIWRRTTRKRSNVRARCRSLKSLRAATISTDKRRTRSEARQARFRGGVARAGVTEIFADDVEPLRQRAVEAKFRRTSARQHLLQLRERGKRRRQLPASEIVVSQIAFAMAGVEGQHAAAGVIEQCGGLIGLGEQCGEVARFVGLNRVAPLQKKRRAQQQDEKPQRHRAEQQRALAKAQRFHRASALIRAPSTAKKKDRPASC